MTRLINMWSGPRNVSTAMMYSWRQRVDTTVWDEPMYGHYLAHTGIDHPGRDETMAAWPTDRDDVLRQMTRGDVATPIRFYKNMAHHLVGFDIDVVDQFENFLLTRDPKDMLPSLQIGLGRVPEMLDTGFEFQAQIVERDLARGRTPIVVDSQVLQDQPEMVLRRLCEGRDVPWDPAMLSGPPGPKPEDGVGAPHWYARLHRTTGFEPYQPKGQPLPAELEDIYGACAPIYEALQEYAIRAP